MPLHITPASTTVSLWREAIASRWSLRLAADESRWRLAIHMTSWLRQFVRQTRWLRVLNASEAMRRVTQADPRLYERWHRPYISTRFDTDTRRRIVGAHYVFLIQRFPARLSERVVLGHGVRVATLRLADASVAYVHLRKPIRGDAGELSLSLLTMAKDVLASCTLTFDAHNSVTVGAMRGAGAHTPLDATGDFIRGSHGLQPRDLLLSLVRELAAVHALKRIRAVASAACVASSPNDMVEAVDDDAFWREQGGVPAASGCFALPLAKISSVGAKGPRSRRERQQRREVFRLEACEAFAAAFRVSARWQPTMVSATSASVVRVDIRRPAGRATDMAPERRRWPVAGR
ncbi:MAG: DUF535 family protein [Rhodanobacter sp.]